MGQCGGEMWADVAQLVERVLGKDEVTGSIPVVGSRSMAYFVYVLRSIPTGRHYVGIAANVASRLEEHNSRTGRWTSAFRPWELLGCEEYPDRRSAVRREAFLKSRSGMTERKQLFERLEGEAEFLCVLHASVVKG